MAYINRKQSAFVRCVVVQWANWLAGLAFVTLSGNATPWAFNILIDGIAAAIILARPAAKFQSVLGAIYLAQISISCGYGLNEIKDTAEPLIYYNMLSLLGWLQLLILGGWGGADLAKRHTHRLRASHHALARAEGDKSVAAT